MRQPSALESELAFQMLACGLPEPKREFRFHPKRMWRFDFAWPERFIGCEVHGGIYSNGRHVRGTGFEKDCNKYSAAALAGYRILHFTAKDIRTGEAIKMIEKVLENVGSGLE